MGLNRLAVQCLTGCAIGEVLGVVLATWWGWGNAASIAISIVLAFFFGCERAPSFERRSGVGNYRFHPLWGFMADLAWVR